MKSQLIGEKDTQARQINVETRNGLVQLSSFAKNAAEKSAADVAKGVNGVRPAGNKIEVR